jgi:hypothetical protein
MVSLVVMCNDGAVIQIEFDIAFLPIEFANAIPIDKIEKQ